MADMLGLDDDTVWPTCADDNNDGLKSDYQLNPHGNEDEEELDNYCFNHVPAYGMSKLSCFIL